MIFAVVIVAVVVLAMTCSGGSDKEESNKEAKGSSKTTTESTSDQTTSKTQTTVTKGNVYNKKNLVIDVDKFDDANTAIWVPASEQIQCKLDNLCQCIFDQWNYDE